MITPTRLAKIVAVVAINGRTGAIEQTPEVIARGLAVRDLEPVRDGAGVFHPLITQARIELLKFAIHFFSHIVVRKMQSDSFRFRRLNF